ncbi:hypothetical protein ACWCPI_14190 [Streptomyces sp. NPDC001920]
MTQSGQGEEPSARPAREGIVLPSDGGEPLLPGVTGGQPGRPAPGQAAPPTAPQPAAPPGGQAWGTPWGPDQNQNPPAPGQAWGTPPGHGWGGQEQPHQPQSQQQAPWNAAPEAHTGAPAHPLPSQSPSYGGGPQGAPPSAPSYGAGPQGAPSYGQGAPAGSPMPAPQPPYGQGGPSAPLPPAGGQGSGAPGYGGASAPLPPAAGGFDEGATQYIPPVGAAPAGTDDQVTRYIPPVAASPAPAADEGATQYLPPVGPGALPPEASAESTQVLRRARQGGGAAPQGAAGPMPPAGSDAEATQYIPPVPGGPAGVSQRQPLSDFDGLFRSEPGGEPPAAATQQLPSIQQPPPHRQGPPGAGYFPPGAQGGYGHDDDHDGRAGRGGGRKGSKVPLLAGVGVGIVALGIGAGALLAGGDGDGGKSDNQPVSATAPTTGSGSSSPSADPAEEQAVALDKLLAVSGDSRTTVINAVAAVKSCQNLPKAAKDLRDAAGQRNKLVTDLAALKVDQLPGHTELTTALNKAWRASASADNHYAAWADQVAGNKKLCRRGQARATDQTQAGNRDSGTASREKKTAAQLWNTIAKKYGLTERQPTQL